MQALRCGTAMLVVMAALLPTRAADEKKTEVKDKPVPTGSPIRAKFSKIDGNKFYIWTKERYLNGNQFALRDKEADLPLAEDVKVRTAAPPQQFDSKGRPKQYTKAELDALKGPDKRAFGYAADLESLKAQQIVELVLGKRKSAPKNEPPIVIEIRILQDPG